MPDWRSSLQKITVLIYLFISSWKWRELGFLPRPLQWQLQMGMAEGSHPGCCLSPFPPGRYAWGRSLVSEEGHSAIPTKYLSKAPFLLALLSTSNLASFVNISWAGCMHSCTKIFLTIETIIALHCYTISCTRSFCFSSLPSSQRENALMARRKQLPAHSHKNNKVVCGTHNVRLNSIKNWKANLD